MGGAVPVEHFEPTVRGKVRGLLHPEVMLAVSKRGTSMAAWKFVVAHETCHAKERHGLIQALSLLVFPLAPFVRRWLERRADRYAISLLGPLAVDAMKEVYPVARSAGDRFVHGADWIDRLRRAAGA